MITANILTNGLGHYKSRAFLLPILQNITPINCAGIDCNIVRDRSEDLTNCDVLLIEDRVYTYDYSISPREMVRELHDLSESVDSLLWFDTTDSAGTLITEVFPAVDGYYKKQLLEDRERYRRPLYGGRLYTDHYHREYGIVDEKKWLGTLNRTAHIDKLGLFWTLGPNLYIPYVHIGRVDQVGRVLNHLPTNTIERIPWRTLLGQSPFWTPIEKERPIDVSGRFSTSYNRSTVDFHRNIMKDEIENRIQNSKIDIRRYWKELRQAKLLLSPFGYGEVCHRDFEGFMSGCVLVKPRMDHLETWPPLYEEGETMLSVDWDMDNLEQTLDYALDNYDEAQAIAEEGQRRYRKYLTDESMSEEFVNRFIDIVNSGDP